MTSHSSNEIYYLNCLTSLGLLPKTFCSTHKDGNTLVNILLNNDSLVFSFVVDRNFSLSDRFPITFQTRFSVSWAVYRNAPTPRFSFKNLRNIDSFVNCWYKITFFDYPSQNCTDVFYHSLWTAIDMNFPIVRKRRLFYPWYYPSHKMHLINKKETMRKNALVIQYKTNLTLLDDVSQDLDQSIELDKVCFSNGHITNSITESFKLLNTLNGTNFAHPMSYKSELLTRKEDFSSAFNSFFLLNIPMTYSI